MEEVVAASSKWIKCISTQGNLRGVAIQATELVSFLVERHQLRDESAQRLGETVMGALLLASYCKEGERINLNIQGSSRIKQALVDAYPDGSVRGYVVEREGDIGLAATLLTEEAQGPWGEGLLSVLRTKVSSREQPYIGTVPLVTGHLAKDLTFYWMQSEQIPSAVGLAVVMDGEKVVSAGGFLVQVLPGATTEEVRAIERNIIEMHSLAQAMGENQDPVYLLSQIFQSSAFLLIEEKPLTFRCTCSWDRVNRALSLVGVEELQLMIAESNGASIRCDFCAHDYSVDAAGLQSLIDAASDSH